MNPFVQIIQFTSNQSLKLEPFFIQETVSKSINESSIFNLSNVIIFVLLGISVIINVLLLIMVKNRNRELKGFEKKHKHDVVSMSEYSKLKGENKRLNSQFQSLHSQLSNYNIQKDKNDSNPNFYQQNQNNSRKTKESLVDSSIEYKEEKPKTKNWEIKKEEEIFLPSPFEDKRFTIEDVSKERTISSLYKIVLNDNGVTGKLLLLEDADFTRALNSPDHYLEKACSYENVFNPNAKGIDVVNSGSVKLENQDWYVTEKIKIKFI